MSLFRKPRYSSLVTRVILRDLLSYKSDGKMFFSAGLYTATLQLFSSCFLTAITLLLAFRFPFSCISTTILSLRLNWRWRTSSQQKVSIYRRNSGYEAKEQTLWVVWTFLYFSYISSSSPSLCVICSIWKEFKYNLIYFESRLFLKKNLWKRHCRDLPHIIRWSNLSARVSRNS